MTERGARSGPLKAGLLATRLLQFIFAVILIGIFAWSHRQMSRAGYFRYHIVDVPLGVSIAALVLTALATFTHLFLHNDSQNLIAFLDFCLFVGYLASCIVYRQNYKTSCGANLLVRVFGSIGSGHCNTVRAGAALLVLQTILFFISMILSHLLSRRRQAVENTPGVHEESSRFGFGKRNQRQGVAV